MPESITDDLDVIRRVREGDRNAYAALVRKYQMRVRGYCVNTLRDAALAEDAAQEIFLKAYQGLPAFRAASSFSTWLYRITANHCRDLQRKAARRPTESLDALLEQEGERAEALLATPAEDRISGERVELVRRALSHLSETSRAVLILREMQGLSYDELAEALGCSLDAVKGRLKRARQELERRLRHVLQPGGVQTGRET